MFDVWYRVQRARSKHRMAARKLVRAILSAGTKKLARAGLHHKVCIAWTQQRIKCSRVTRVTGNRSRTMFRAYGLQSLRYFIQRLGPGHLFKLT